MFKEKIILLILIVAGTCGPNNGASPKSRNKNSHEGAEASVRGGTCISNATAKGANGGARDACNTTYILFYEGKDNPYKRAHSSVLVHNQ